MRTPKSLNGAVRQVVAGLDDDSISTLKCMNENEARATGHRTIGRWIRNHWGLAERKGPLYQWFVKNLDLHHPSDMTGVIIHCVWSRVTGRERDVEDLVGRMRAHWKRHGRRPNGSFLNVLAILEHGEKKECLTVHHLLGNHIS